MILTKEENEDVIRKKVGEIEKKYGKEAKIDVLGIISIVSNNIEKTEYIPVTMWNTKHPYPTTNAIRGLMQRRILTAPIVFKCGKRTLIDESLMLKWIRNNLNNINESLERK